MAVNSTNFITSLKLKGLTYNEFVNLSAIQQTSYYSARIRRSLKRLNSSINNINPILRIYKNAVNKSNYKIRRKGFIILPQHVDKIYYVHNGKSYEKLKIVPPMVGKYIGAFVLTKKYPNHNKASKSGKNIRNKTKSKVQNTSSKT
jgi:small subunit ribosomal protein S19